LKWEKTIAVELVVVAISRGNVLAIFGKKRLQALAKKVFLFYYLGPRETTCCSVAGRRDGRILYPSPPMAFYGATLEQQPYSNKMPPGVLLGVKGRYGRCS
jgi:hypothetical protein